ncbi:MAG: hypothetical protein NPIRA02_28780 [Nitrospirales bacterium]|nr:MAG: hypothetical protein NPIRA02_28780 [Nitrospirales bacterium]
MISFFWSVIDIILAFHMSHRVSQKIVTIVLSCCFLAVSTTYAGAMANHATAHHSQDSHGQSWCDWLCKASQAIQTPTVQLAQAHTYITPLLSHEGEQYVLCFNLSPGSRGPPIYHCS